MIVVNVRMIRCMREVSKEDRVRNEYIRDGIIVVLSKEKIKYKYIENVWTCHKN